jgi:hypothetical protein
VTNVFWVSFSAYARGAPAAQVNKLLYLISTENKARWHEDDVFRTEWRRAHDGMVDWYVQKLQYYGEMFMQSPAGQRYKETVSKKREQKRALPEANVAMLRSYEGVPGISWGIAEIYDFFKLLDQLTLTSSVSSQVCSCSRRT